MLSDQSLAERSRFVDRPAFAAAEAIAAVVPADACIGILTYAGADAITYYGARFDYLLYPRRAHVVADSNANFDGCGYLAVFRDTPANLAASPFAGVWDEAALSVRLSSLSLLHRDEVVEVFSIE